MNLIYIKSANIQESCIVSLRPGSKNIYPFLTPFKLTKYGIYNK